MVLCRFFLFSFSTVGLFCIFEGGDISCGFAGEGVGLGICKMIFLKGVGSLLSGIFLQRDECVEKCESNYFTGGGSLFWR